MTWVAKYILVDTTTDEKKEGTEEFPGYTKDTFDDNEHYRDVIEYMYTEGNQSCDCNRHDMFYPKYEDDYPCGDGRFKLLKLDIFKGNELMGSFNYK